eukprot:IDg3684t1
MCSPSAPPAMAPGDELRPSPPLIPVRNG